MTEPTWQSLLPPLIAIGLAIASRRVLLPLLAGILTGAFLMVLAADVDAEWASLLWPTVVGFVDALLTSLRDKSHQQVLAFSLLLGAMVGVLEHGGGMKALLQSISQRIRTRRGAQTLISFSGLAIFFDDYANTLLVGGAYRSLADRYGISRAKLAYLVDSTAAPVAGLALVSTWVATEVSFLEDGLRNAGVAESNRAFELFLASIPYRFYPWLALVMVFAVSISGRDFGPMRDAEAIPAPPPLETNPPHQQPVASTMQLAIAAILPVLSCVAAVAVALMVTGSEPGEDPVGIEATSSLQSIGRIIGNGDSYLSLIIGGAVGLIAAWLGAIRLGHQSISRLAWGTMRGAWQMMPAMIVLWLAWALSAMTTPEQLNTAGYLSGLLSDRLAPEWLPTTVFLLSGCVAFATGTSWGTMAILTPISVGLALQIDPVGGVEGPILLATFSSVLAGSIFGDHCSPISDTTVLSSRSSGCNHIEHVKTQMPYACLVGGVCIVGGTIPVAWGVSPWICLAFSSVALVIAVRVFGRTPDGSRNNGTGHNLLRHEIDSVDSALPSEDRTL